MNHTSHTIMRREAVGYALRTCSCCGAQEMDAETATGATKSIERGPDPQRLRWWLEHYQRHARASRRYGWRLRLLARLRRALRPDPGPDPVTGEERR